MRPLRDVSLRVKLRALNVVTGAVSLVMAFAAFLAYDLYAVRESTRVRLETLAQVVGKQSTAAISFDDPKNAAEILRALSAEPRILTATIYRMAGTRLGSYVRADTADASPESRPPADGSVFREMRLEVTRPIAIEGERLGTIHLASDLTEVGERFRRNGAVMLAILLGSATLTLLLCFRLEGTITRPILDLAGTMTSVSRTKDYSLRALSHGRDETGSLVEGFNRMLSEIEERDGALRTAHDTLEKRVTDRTAELSRAEKASRESEERYRQLIDLSPDAILIHEAGLIVLANAAALRLLRAGAAADVLGRPFLGFIDPGQRAMVEEQLRLLLDQGKTHTLQEQRYARLDGTMVDVEVAVAPLSFGGKRAVMTIVRDISQRKEVENLKGEFVSTVSHELRTPLTSIRGSLGLLASGALGPIPPKAKPMLDIANSNCQRLVRLINDILDIEKIGAGKIDLQLRRLELAPLLATAVEASRGFAEPLGVTYVIENVIPGARVTADSDRLLQVMANLLSNAAKFSERGSTVEIHTERRGGRLRVSVRDHGSGIPKEFQSRIFQKFAQADSSDTRQKGGTGLGLSICKAILERMGGSIDYRTAPGIGTTFFFELPEFAEAVLPAVVEKDAPAVLVVEDDSDVSLLLSLMLRQAGFTADVAASAAEARRKLKSGVYAAMTLDIMLPDESGITFLREIRREAATRHLPVIIVSAKAQSARRELEGSALSVVDWIEKPIEPKNLMAAVESAVHASSGGKARILHIEDDPGIIELVRASVQSFATTTGAPTLEAARLALAAGAFDLVILDVLMPDGSGLDLLPALKDSAGHPLPVLVFSAYDLKLGVEDRIQGILVKSKVSNEELLEKIQSILKPVVARIPPRGGSSAADDAGAKADRSAPG